MKRPLKVKKRKKRKKRSPRQIIIDRLDTLFRDIVRTRDRYQCRKEGCPANGNRMHAAHIWSRNNKIIRWEKDNGLTMCYYHHLLWSHRQPAEFTEWAKEQIGEKRYYELRDISNQGVKTITDEELLEIEQKLIKELNEIKLEREEDPF